MRIRLAVILAALCLLGIWAASAHAALVASYLTDNTMVDASGNGYTLTPNGSGGVFSSNSPTAFLGNYCWNPNNAGDLSVPNAALTSLWSVGGSKTGCIKLNFMTDGPDQFTYGNGYSCVFSWLVGGWQNEIFVRNGQSVTIGMHDSTTARQVIDATTGIFRWSSWQTLMLNWTPTGFNVYVTDTIAGVTTKVISADPMPGSLNPFFGAVSSIKIGSGSTAYAHLWVNNVKIYDTPQTVDPDLNTGDRGYAIIDYGSSQVQGTECGNYAWRDGFLSRQRATNNHKYYFNGTQFRLLVGGLYTESNWCPWQEGYSGMASSTGVTQFLSSEATMFPFGHGTGDRLVYVLGPYGGDAVAASESWTVKTQMDAIANTVWAQAPNAAVVFANINAMPGQPTWTVSKMNAGALGSYNAFAAQGKKVLFFDWFSNVLTTCGDQVHPDDAGYVAGGQYFYPVLDNYLGSITPTPTPTPQPGAAPRPRKHMSRGLYLAPRK